MREHEYIEGQQALESFEEGMKALFKAPKAQTVSPKKKRKSASVVKPKSDKD